MKLLSVVGARPQFVKLAPISEAALAAGVDHTIVHTGQHYDAAMSDSFFETLSIPSPDVNLRIGSGPHGVQTGAMLAALEPVLAERQPDWVLVYGDTNSTLAAAVCAAKLQLPLAHLEAGLRSFNRAMPEEHNRVLTDHCADLLLAPTPLARQHLEREGLGERTVVVGDVMTDVCLRVRDRVVDDPAMVPFDVAAPFRVSTIHRAENTDDPARLDRIVTSLQGLPQRVVLVAHPRLVARAEQHGITLEGGAIELAAPMAYPQLIAAVLRSEGVVTDSGGLQKEAYLLGRPCTTLRTETEWEETLTDGWNVLAEPADLAAKVGRPVPTGPRPPHYGAGDAAHRVIAELVRRAGA
ncbi:UDP-N-acetyl glucosamine 2-epimerase [Nocardioides sp. Root1257]|uniref:non-hydrolyzing UDP-N-acetylglucosamine 2-epimerase n=1 Tax=unclassified Nocardioides TaxID=2615069 RepID=UPI0006FAF682|nr:MULTISPECIES: UDP-N-acetylglucosamine 2-epimerase (non-hydrolyzing) [unclassified Nocardioides]KQW47798.1 UDP-N-acetyl glucosamine 2-epimerase [Nocardioides sp. Root1257]KRC45050.1 UDP-N-acetyl glucosamine 2-epimerase [Nocardioides sp. Root224]